MNQKHSIHRGRLVAMGCGNGQLVDRSCSMRQTAGVFNSTWRWLRS
jgi:hypothetical protein